MKDQESICTFKLNDKTSMVIPGFDRKLLKIAGQHTADSLLYIIHDLISQLSPNWYHLVLCHYK